MAKPKSPEPVVYQLKVSLKGSKPPIWRRVLVKSDHTLEDLHTIIQIVMGWEDSHLHAFNISEQFYEPKTLELVSPLEDENSIDERTIVLSSVIWSEKQQFFYEYDFGDSWQHTIVVEKFLPIDPTMFYPTCLTGKRACPPDDCGGIWGYEELLEILANPEHPEYEERKEWLGEEFDPAFFDLRGTQAVLQEIFG